MRLVTIDICMRLTTTSINVIIFSLIFSEICKSKINEVTFNILFTLIRWTGTDYIYLNILEKQNQHLSPLRTSLLSLIKILFLFDATSGCWADWLIYCRGNELLRSLQNVCQDLWLMTLTPLLTWLGLRLWTIWMIMKQNQVSMIHSVSTHHWASYIRVGQNLSIVITSDKLKFYSLRINPIKACVSLWITVYTLFYDLKH